MSGRIDLFARAAFIKVEPGCKVELTRTFEDGIVPLFRKEKDFRGLLAFTFPNGAKALSVSLWDQKDTAGGTWARGVRTLAALAKVALGTHSVQVFEVSNGTSHAVEQTTGHGDEVEAPADLRIYQSALRPFNVAPARRMWGWGFPRLQGLIASFKS
jgi:hypothetical protein